MPPRDFSSHYQLGRLEDLLEAGTLLLTPNQRLARSIKASWDRGQVERGRRVWRPATVHALDLWLQERWREGVAGGRLPARVRLTPLQENELWAQVIAADAESNGAYRLLQPGGAAELAAAARESLIQTRIDTAAPAVAAGFRLDEDCATFLRWSQAFEAALGARGLATRADCLRDLAAADGEPALQRAVLVDCDELTPLQSACLATQVGSLEAVSGVAGEAPLVARSWPDRAAELGAVARWAAAAWRENRDCRLGIVLRDMQGDREALEYLLRREFDCLGENYTALPVNFSTGISLDRAPVVRDALRMLACCDRELPLADVLGLLTTRFCAHPVEMDDAMVRLVQRLHADGRERVDSGRLRALAAGDREAGEPASLGVRLGAIRDLRLHRVHQQPSLWAEQFHAVLELWGWPGSEALDSLEYQQVNDWYKVLETFAGCDAVAGELDFGAATGLLRRCCRSEVSQPQTADSGIQVLGRLEAAGLHFDTIWLCGLEAGHWPAPARPNPFLPLQLQRDHAMPHASGEDEWRHAERLLRQYRGCCSMLIASYARQLEGAPVLPSPLLRGLAVEICEDVGAPPAAWLAQMRTADVAARADDTGPALAGEGAQAGGSKVLENQANCPFRAFATHRLGAEVLGDLHAGLSARERGIILHDALCALWENISDSATLAGLGEASCAEVANSAADAAIDAAPEPLRLRVGMHCLDLERRRLQSLLLEWLNVERGRPPFRVQAREAPREFALGALTLELRVDRVDRLEDGRELVIDYKSGQCKLAKWLDERPVEPQLPLYALATGAAGVAFAQVRARECQLLGLGDVAGVPGVSDDIGKATKRYEPASDWSELLGQWRERLEGLAQEFVAGEARVDPLKRACDYCGLQPLCRIDHPVENAV